MLLEGGSLMKRFLAPAVLASCFSFLFAVAATAQDSETRPTNTTWLGDTGLWFVPTGEILPDGKWSVSGYRANIDYEQGLSDVSHFVGTFGVGINDRVEIFGSVRADTRIRRVARPLFDSESPDHGGVLNDYPNVTDFWNGNNFGDVVIGAKFNITSEHRLQPAALALRTAVKVPTGDEKAGKSSGATDVMVDFIASKNVSDRLEFSGFTGFLFRGNPSGMTLGHSVNWGIGAGFPTSGRVRLFTELHGQLPLKDNVVLTSALTGVDGTLSPLLSAIATPASAVVGLQFQSQNGFFVGVGLSYAMHVEDVVGGTLGHLWSGSTGNRLGLQIRLGFHPGVRRYVAPPPPPEPPTVATPSPPPPVLQLPAMPPPILVVPNADESPPGAPR